MYSINWIDIYIDCKSFRFSDAEYTRGHSDLLEALQNENFEWNVESFEA